MQGGAQRLLAHALCLALQQFIEPRLDLGVIKLLTGKANEEAVMSGLGACDVLVEWLELALA